MINQHMLFPIELYMSSHLPESCETKSTTLSKTFQPTDIRIEVSNSSLQKCHPCLQAELCGSTFKKEYLLSDNLELIVASSRKNFSADSFHKKNLPLLQPENIIWALARCSLS